MLGSDGDRGYKLLVHAQIRVLPDIELPDEPAATRPGAYRRGVVAAAVRLAGVRGVQHHDPADLGSGAAAAGGDMGGDSEEDGGGGDAGGVEADEGWSYHGLSGKACLMHEVTQLVPAEIWVLWGYGWNYMPGIGSCVLREC